MTAIPVTMPMRASASMKRPRGSSSRVENSAGLSSERRAIKTKGMIDSTLADARAFRVALLHGVTGSGKTEIYLRLSAAVCAAGRRVLMLVPEIALTPAMAALFRQTFDQRVAIQHSGLSDGERHDQWQRIRSGDILSSRMKSGSTTVNRSRAQRRRAPRRARRRSGVRAGAESSPRRRRRATPLVRRQ